jgi:hypothetical protein
VRLQAAADRAASKHIDDARNRGKAGALADATSRLGRRRRRETRDWREGGRSRCGGAVPLWCPRGRGSESAAPEAAATARVTTRRHCSSVALDARAAPHDIAWSGGDAAPIRPPVSPNAAAWVQQVLDRQRVRERGAPGRPLRPDGRGRSAASVAGLGGRGGRVDEGADRVEQFLDVVIEEQFLASQVLACHRPRGAWLSVLPPVIVHPGVGGLVAWLHTRICSQHTFCARDSPGRCLGRMLQFGCYWSKSVFVSASIPESLAASSSLSSYRAASAAGAV